MGLELSCLRAIGNFLVEAYADVYILEPPSNPMKNRIPILSLRDPTGNPENRTSLWSPATPAPIYNLKALQAASSPEDGDAEKGRRVTSQLIIE